MKTEKVMNRPKGTLFEVCKELNNLAFPVSRRDDALFYIRPDMCVRQQDFDAILDERNKPFATSKRPLIDELIFIPTEADLFRETPDVNQLTKTNTAGWFAYTGLRPQEDADYFRGNGITPWFALADVWIQIKRWKTGADLKPGDIIN